MGDQFAICDREKDFIFIINSDNQGHSPATRAVLYHALYEYIVNELGETLPENGEAYAELANHIKNIKLFNLRESTTSPFAEKLNKTTYVLEDNPMGIKYVHFNLEGDKGVLTYENAQGVKRLPFGFGHNEFSKFPQVQILLRLFRNRGICMTVLSVRTGRRNISCVSRYRLLKSISVI